MSDWNGSPRTLAVSSAVIGSGLAAAALLGPPWFRAVFLVLSVGAAFASAAYVVDTARRLHHGVPDLRQRILANFAAAFELSAERPKPSAGIGRPWAIEFTTAISIVRMLQEYRPRVVVELGPGASTRLILDHPDPPTRLISVEHDAGYFRTLEERFAGTKQLELVCAPLSYLSLPSWQGAWYATDTLLEIIGPTIDFLFIDGPPSATGRMSRYPALPVLWDRLAPGALILLDDTSREEESAITDRWMAEFSLEVIYDDVNHTVLKKG